MNRQHKVFSWPVRVYFQDTDAGGVVYHASYVNFMERARTEWLRSFGYSNAGLMQELGVMFVVRSIRLDYLKPALLDDMLHVSAQIKEMGRSRVTLVQKVLRRPGAAEQSSPGSHAGQVKAEGVDGMRGEELLTEGEVHLVCVQCATFKPTAVPDVLRNQWKV